ncbi:ribonucleoside-diphosphate reductase subunit alpha [Kytococcus sedentarius]|uniref:Ribonucleoside-diphosphate reductase n=1 Tax=Kytococcus sedentarius (strain ATCC 14392 / DSM 20547 / JCM 11482 / CCUG 33030 / NBRC 15357 / NCTC 11040 / CCM 314 / 541) TaxID=478801 RepID=C7NLI3_KYTSD|nr:ribonucleoside-diphosphate reductase subunit alpha [Kytococcus sedentarius]ACV07179.1 ribonucleoside-diphosphate reductase, alpha subunit [Kytococcus sedentarius DSM 20547]STX13988.1 Ribonucleoside-diphosphate reductase 1 subunit alpha [Kytococcus sedentarius]
MTTNTTTSTATPTSQPADGDQPTLEGVPTTPARTTMRVVKRSGEHEQVDVTKIVAAVERCCDGLPEVDPLRVATKTISGLYDGATTAELDKLAIATAAEMTATEPQYSRLAGRLLAGVIDKEVRGQGIGSFSAAVRTGHEQGLIGDETAAFVAEHASRLDDAVYRAQAAHADWRFDYFGLRTVYDRYLLRHPLTRAVVESPQYWLMRVSAGLSHTGEEAVEFFELLSSLAYLPSSPTLFNSGTRHTQMSSCYLIDSPQDDLDSIYERYHQVAKLSKFAGGIGLAFSRIRSRGALIRGTNGHSNGIVPWLRTLDASVAAVNQGGRRKGAACIYLEPWHPDVEEFLELRDNTGEDARRTHNLNLAHWIPDEFMRRVEADGQWSLIDPDAVPELPDLWGPAFDAAYRAAEERGDVVRTVSARYLYGRMMRTLAQTGQGWMTFKDASNRACNQTSDDQTPRVAADGTVQPAPVVHLSNLCTEIIEVTSNDETAVCNLGSVNLAAHLQWSDGTTGVRPTDPAARATGIDTDRLRSTVRLAVTYLDRVIDINYYPSEQAAASNPRWRPIGLGSMGLQDVFFALRMPFDAPEAKELSTRIAEEIQLSALERSAELAEQFGAHPAFAETRAARGQLQHDLQGVEPTQTERWAAVRQRIADHGLRNSLMIAIAPTATIASIAGCYECIEPQVSNLFKRETLSGEFMQVNTALVGELKSLGLWTEAVREKLKADNGSVAGIADLPEETRRLFRTAWELPQKALIEMAAARQAYVDQSQSLNLFMESPNIGKLSSMYLYAWKAGLKTTYYLRSRPATRIQQATVAGVRAGASWGAATGAPGASQPTAPGSPGVVGGLTASEPVRTFTDEEALACSLENPEACEACE